MIARPPQKSSSAKRQSASPFLSKVANDNRPPQKTILGWCLFGVGILLLMMCYFWF